MNYSLWDEIPDPSPQTHEAAKSKRPEGLDAQPAQERMRASIKPGARRNISSSEKKVRHQQARQQGQTKTAGFDALAWDDDHDWTPGDQALLDEYYRRKAEQQAAGTYIESPDPDLDDYPKTAGIAEIGGMSDDDLKSYYLGISPDASYELSGLKDQIAAELQRRGVDLLSMPRDYFEQDFPNGVPLPPEPEHQNWFQRHFTSKEAAMAQCEFDAPHHSDDRVQVHSGETEGHTLCGYHAQNFLPEFYQQLRAGASGRDQGDRAMSSLHHTAATPPWLYERVNDPYGTPNKAYDKDKGEYYDNPFWTENPPEVVGRYKIIQKDGLWYGYDTSQNMWTVGFPDKQSVLDMAARPRLDMHAHYQPHNTQEMTRMDSTTFAQKEAALLQRMASAHTAFDQDQARSELEALRNTRSDQIAAEGSLDFDAALAYDGGGILSGAGLAPLSFAQASLGRTASVTASAANGGGSGDWLDDIETMETVSSLDRDHSMRTEATLWYEGVHPVLRNDREEFSRQARSAAMANASSYQEAAPAAVQAFLDQVDHIHTHAGFQPVLRAQADQTAPGWAGFDPMGVAPATDLQTGDHGFGSGSSLPVGVSPAQAPQTADGLVNGGDTTLPSASGLEDQKSTDADKAPSLDHGSAPATGTSGGNGENPIAYDDNLDKSTQPGDNAFDQIDGYPSGGQGNAATASMLAPRGITSANDWAGVHTAAGDVVHAPSSEMVWDGDSEHTACDPDKKGTTSDSPDGVTCPDCREALWLDGDPYHQGARRTADAAPTDYPNASGMEDPKAPAAYGDAPSIDHGSAPEGDTSATPGQVADNTGASGDLDKANTEQNPDYVPTGGTGGNPATSGPMAGTPTASIKQIAGGLLVQSAVQISQNAATFLSALVSMESLDSDLAGVTGHQMVGFLLEDSSVPDQTKHALRQAQAGGAVPFVREAASVCRTCGESITKKHDPSGQRGEAWATNTWSDANPHHGDMDFQCFDSTGHHVPGSKQASGVGDTGFDGRWVSTKALQADDWKDASYKDPQGNTKDGYVWMAYNDANAKTAAPVASGCTCSSGTLGFPKHRPGCPLHDPKTWNTGKDASQHQAGTYTNPGPAGQVMNPWNNKPISCSGCGHDTFRTVGRSLDTYDHECTQCGKINHTMTETGMSASLHSASKTAASYPTAMCAKCKGGMHVEDTSDGPFWRHDNGDDDLHHTGQPVDLRQPKSSVLTNIAAAFTS